MQSGKNVDREHRPLPANRAFVVQLRSDANVEQGQLSGRIEHVVSGRATHFESLDDVLAFMSRIAGEQRVGKGR